MDNQLALGCRRRLMTGPAPVTAGYSGLGLDRCRRWLFSAEIWP